MPLTCPIGCLKGVPLTILHYLPSVVYIYKRIMSYQLVTVLYIRDTHGNRRKKVELTTHHNCLIQATQLHTVKIDGLLSS